MPELSVLLPARNAEGTIARAVSSTLRALPRDAELVVLDDGSTDGTAERARQAGRDVGARGGRLRVVTRPASGGISRALGSLLEMTDSRLVGRMDADDVSLPGRFRTTCAAIDGGDDVVFTQIIDLVGRRLRPQPPLGISPRAFPLHLLLTNPVSHPTMVARREVIETVGAYRDVPAEDYDLWIRCAAHGARLRRVAPWGLLYRGHPGQITASQEWRNSSWTDPRQADAFAELSEKVTGRRLTRLVALTAVDPPHRAERLAEFTAAVEPAVNAVGGPQGIVLRRRLRTRIRQIENWAPAPAAPAPDNRGTTAAGEDRP